MNETKVEFASAGRTFAGLVFEPENAAPRRHGGVTVFHGGAGPGPHERERAERLTQLGYVALLPDLFGEVFETRQRGEEVITGLVSEPALLRARLLAALDCLCAQPSVDESRIAAIGFCFGGFAALELARSGAMLRAAVSFHGGLVTRAPAETNAVRASILVCTGAADPFVTRQHRQAFEDEMVRANADFELHVYANAMHGFTERGIQRPGSAYHEAADRRSWWAMQSLLAHTLG
jgi:dienelactone hydrolase